MSARAPIIVARSMQRLFAVVERVAAGDVTVLVTGETGVGKELVVDALHRHSRRAAGPLLRLNTAALPASLVESELFGHQRGAFTGALCDHPGLLESAHGGTVLLDEIGELSGAVQAKLLRVLEDRQVLRVGGVRPRMLDVRFVASTHRDLDAAVAAGTFREDLYYRLTGVVLRVPPLRERLEDVAPMTRAFVAEAATRAGHPVPDISDDVWPVLEQHPWPGNVRELRNVAERAVLLAAGDRIELEHCTLGVARSPRASMPVMPAPVIESIRQVRPGRARRPLERPDVVEALACCGGNQTEAAKLLGISRRALSTKLDTLDILRPRKRC